MSLDENKMKIIFKNNFAIEFELYEKNYALLRLIFDGKFIGTLETETYLPSFIYSLECILNNDYYNENITDINYKDFFFIENEITNIYRVTLEESFDDFTKRVIRNNSDLYFLFCLEDNPFFSYDIDIKEYFTKVSIIDFLSVLNSFKEAVNDYFKG